MNDRGGGSGRAVGLTEGDPQMATAMDHDGGPRRDRSGGAGGAAGEFEAALVALLPRLRLQAWALTRERAAAEDLVQDVVAGALAARGRYVPDPAAGFAAWVHRILRNRFLDTRRRQRRTVDIDDVAESAVAIGAAHEERLVLGELRRALVRLPAAQREALMMVALEGMDYGAVAAATRSSVGTAKSRVFRARRRLQAELRGATREHRSPRRSALRRPRSEGRQGRGAPGRRAAHARTGPDFARGASGSCRRAGGRARAGSVTALFERRRVAHTPAHARRRRPLPRRRLRH
jgi:RNA polymerase sigma-70 factor (ECF subfamily)